MTAPDTPTEEVTPAYDGEHVDAHTTFQIVDSLQIILTALMLAFMLRAFFIEAFIIPTGSMAPGLLGRHAVEVCPNCGLEFDYGPTSRSSEDPAGFNAPETIFCPNCHARLDIDPAKVDARSGDRILVHKWPYLFGGRLGPDRWDVVVFRDPGDPDQNFIKRLAGLPNESIEIIDGDVYIKSAGEDAFHIVRKTGAAQSMLWFNVYDQDYLPRDKCSPEHPPAWVAEGGRNGSGSGGWGELHKRVIRYKAGEDGPHTLRFDPDGSRYYMQDVYAYNHGSGGNYVGDVRVRGEMRLLGGDGRLTLEITRDSDRFRATIYSDGRAALTDSRAGEAGDERELAAGTYQPRAAGREQLVEFGHLDYRVYLKIDGREILATSDEQYAPDPDMLRRTQRIKPVEIRMIADGMNFEIGRLRVDRDVHYSFSRANTLRAYPDHPFVLGEDEYFVLGDNSPNSHDSREWYEVGPHLEEAFYNDEYQAGAVRGDQIVGRAFFVYLPSLLPISEGSRWRIPDLGRMRFIR